jgi:hypothetical protein
MARAITVTENAIGSIVHSSPITKLVGVSKIVETFDEAGEGVVITKNFRTENAQRKTVELSATLLADINAAVAAEVNAVAVTVKNVDGNYEPLAVPYTKNIAVDSIVEAYADPSDPADTVLIVEDESKSIPLTYVIDEDFATLEAAVNA